MALLIPASCTEIEEHPDGRMSLDEVFDNPKRVAGYLNYCYQGLGASRGDQFGDNVFLACYTDDAHDVADLTNGDPYKWNHGRATAYSNPTGLSDLWSSLYQHIHKCNIFLERIGTARTFNENDRVSYTAQAHGLRAYYYLRLIQNFGPVPLILVNTETDGFDYSTVKKSTFTQCVRQIIADAEEVINCEELGFHSGSSDAERYIMNKGMAYAIISRAALLAASPLYSDGGISWAEAAELTKEALDKCLANGYKLYSGKPDASGYSSYDAYFYSRSDVSGSSDPETILEAPNHMGLYGSNGLPTINGQSRAGTCPTQELIDCYETTDGKAPILGYADADHLQPIINPEATLYDEANPYANRDPRLKASVYYNGALQQPDATAKVSTADGGNCEISSDDLRYTRTGYYLRKFTNCKSSRSSNMDGYYKVFRLAELYLNYAEAAVEASAAVPADAIDAVNAIRKRAGMPSLDQNLTRDKFIERLRNERRVEFAFEEIRFYDIRRWKILDKTGTVVTGIRPTADGYQRFVVDRRTATDDKYLLQPIPGDEVVRLMNATGTNFQNAGW